MWDQSQDPLGIALMGRAKAARDKQHLDSMSNVNSMQVGGPAPDPKWDGFFQAMNEAGVTGLADNSVGVKKGMFGAEAPLPDTYNPRYQITSLKGKVGRSNQINSKALPSMQGIDSAIG